MKIYSAIVGNLHAPEWAERAAEADIETVELDQWTAQKSRFVAPGDRGNEYAVALERHSQLLDGDILEYGRPLPRKSREPRRLSLLSVFPALSMRTGS